MSNMIQVWYEHMLAQIAPDSYLDDLLDAGFDFKNPVDLRERSPFGANYYSVIDRFREEGSLNSTQMTSVMIDDFPKNLEENNYVYAK